MVAMNSGIKMPGDRKCPRIDTIGIKLQIELKLGQQKADKYFNLLNRYLSLKLSKSEFDKLCISLIGRENIRLHNGLLQAIIQNAHRSKTPPPKHCKGEASLNVKVPNGYQSNGLQSLCADAFPQLCRKGRTPIVRDRKFRDRPSPLGLNGKTHSIVCEDSISKVQKQGSATELQSLTSKPPVEVISVEEGEEVEQASGSSGIYSRSPVRAPLGVYWNTKGTKKVLRHGAFPFPYSETCQNTCMLPDTNSLKKRLEQKLEMEGLSFSKDSIDLLNNGLNVYMKRLLKPCLELAASRSENKLLHEINYQGVSGLNGMRRPIGYVQKLNRSYAASLLDFRSGMELNPRILGEDWPIQLEKISSRASDESFMGE